jgi:hypothetical protein
MRSSEPVEVCSRKCAAVRTSVTAGPLDSVVFGVGSCKLGPVLTLCSSCVSFVDVALHIIVRCLHLPHVNIFINRYVVLTNTKLRQSELETDMYTLSGSQ